MNLHKRRALNRSLRKENYRGFTSEEIPVFRDSLFEFSLKSGPVTVLLTGSGYFSRHRSGPPFSPTPAEELTRDSVTVPEEHEWEGGPRFRDRKGLVPEDGGGSGTVR